MPNNPNAAFFQFVPLIFIFAIFYFLLIRPQKKKQKEHQELVQKLAKNDEVVTAGGIHGTIVNVKEKTFILRVDEQSKIQIDKSAVAHVVKKR
ncbi:MAG: preprotein translocase subunit YajC [Candidatus Omnitrophica bacterium]|nr:preprotein translocase subunit YajC [Candidatus Omnitrophota bacterium]